MRLEVNQLLYVGSLGKAVRVTAIFTSVQDSNGYLAAHSDEGVVAEFGPYVFIANNQDGDTPIPRARQRLRRGMTTYTRARRGKRQPGAQREQVAQQA
jgi:hypothetical protein